MQRSIVSVLLSFLSFILICNCLVRQAIGMAATRKTRQAADPSIRVADLQDCIEQWLAAYGTRNVPTLLTKLDGATWKTAPIPAALASLQPLLTCLRWFQLQVITLFAI